MLIKGNNYILYILKTCMLVFLLNFLKNRDKNKYNNSLSYFYIFKI